MKKSLKRLKILFKPLKKLTKKRAGGRFASRYSNLKNFLLGAFIALIPMSFYGYLRLYQEGYKPILPEVREKSTYEGRVALLMVDYESMPTATPIPTNTPSPVPTKPPVKMTASVEVRRIVAPAEIAEFIERYAREYGVNYDMMLAIAKCESGFRTDAVSGPYAGIYQFIASTWSSNRVAMGLDPNPELRYNPEESARTAAFKMSRDGFGAWPACSRKARTQLGAI